MSGEKRFRTSLFGGFTKSDVTIYIEKMIKEFDSKLKEKDEEISLLKNQNREMRIKHDDLLRKNEQILEEKSKVDIAEVLIKAQETAKSIIDEAKHKAIDEKKELEVLVEEEREKLVDMRQELKLLRSEVVNTLKKYEEQLNTFIKDEQVNTFIKDEKVNTFVKDENANIQVRVEQPDISVEKDEMLNTFDNNNEMIVDKEDEITV